MNISTTGKRIIAGVVGTLYAVVYGFWTLFATGGGHGNFIWFGLFFFAGCFGLYYPIMAILAIDLRERFIRIVFGGLIVFNLAASIIMIVGWITEQGGDRASDFSKVIQHSGLGSVVFCAAMHFWPTILFSVLLIRSVVGGGSIANADAPVSLNLT